MALRNCSTENRIMPNDRPRSVISNNCRKIVWAPDSDVQKDIAGIAA